MTENLCKVRFVKSEIKNENTHRSTQVSNRYFHTDLSYIHGIEQQASQTPTTQLRESSVLLNHLANGKLKNLGVSSQEFCFCVATNQDGTKRKTNHKTD